MSLVRSVRAVLARSGRIRNEEGQNLVEFALVFTVLSSVLLGIIWAGWALYIYNFVSEAAREATRYASVRGTACTGFSDCNIDSTGLTTFVQNMGYPAINMSGVSVTGSWPCASTANPPCNSPGNPVIVTVSYQFSFAIPFATTNTLNLSSTSQMYISQ